MPSLDIPGFGNLSIEHIVLDYNGTLAVDGTILPGIADRLRQLADVYTIHVITADTFGAVRRHMASIPCEITILPSGNQAEGKFRYIRELGTNGVAAIGNGSNDRMMLEAAALGIAVMQEEGAAREALLAADIVVTDIRVALDLFMHPLRLTATLRS